MSHSAKTRTEICVVTNTPSRVPRSLMAMFRRIAASWLGLLNRFLSSDFIQKKVLGDLQRWIVALIWIAIFIALFSYGDRGSQKGKDHRSETYHRTINF